MKESYFQITLANILHKLLSVIHSKKKNKKKISNTTIIFLLSRHPIKEVFLFGICLSVDFVKRTLIFPFSLSLRALIFLRYTYN